MATSKKAASKKKSTTAKKAAVKKKVVAKKKVAARKTPAKKKAVAKKTTAGKKTTAKKSTASKAAPKKKAAPAKKAAAKKTTAKKPSAKKNAPAGKAAQGSTAIAGIAPYQARANEEYMNEAQTEHFRNLLLAWKRELMEEVDRTVHHMQDEAANFPDPNDRATQESEFSMELRTRDRERKLIKKIDEALEKLEHNEYGYCEACGVEIGIRRLEARPTATLCIDCKALDEIREKQMGG